MGRQHMNTTHRDGTDAGAAAQGADKTGAETWR